MIRLLSSLLLAILGKAKSQALIQILFGKMATQTNAAEAQQNEDFILGVYVTAAQKKRIAESAATKIPRVPSYDNKEVLPVEILNPSAPWKSISIPDCNIPGMIQPEEAQYYLYLGKFYQGKGDVVEIGPWLGRSTWFICEGLKNNPAFKDKKMSVYDDFTWRSSWMDQYVEPNERMAPYANFQPLFEKYTAAFKNSLDVKKQKLVVYDGNDNVPDFEWKGGPIEMLYVDCGRMIEVNSFWYKKLRPYFIKNTTLIVMQDWKTNEEVPWKYYNQTKQFTGSFAHELVEVQETIKGAIATFLFTGN